MGKITRHKRRSDDEIVRILAEADIAGVMPTAEKYNISFKSIYNYYDRLTIEPHLSMMYREHKKLLQESWAEELAETIIAGARVARQMIVDPNSDLVRLGVIINAVKTFSEIKVASEAIGGGTIDVSATSTYYEVD